MSQNSKIEWTNSTWNPTTGCTKISAGCTNCYAERLAVRLKAMGNPNYINGFKLTLQPHMLYLPLTWKKPQMIFVNSMSDLFHENIPLGYIESVIDVIRKAKQHKFQILTKRAERLAELSKNITWPDNAWVGVTVESNDYTNRIEFLRLVNAKVRFISFEPLLTPIIDPDLTGIDWVIVGGESGPKSRTIEESWVKNIRDYCIEFNIPFFFKQWGGTRKKINGRVLEGTTWEMLPKYRAINCLPIT